MKYGEATHSGHTKAGKHTGGHDSDDGREAVHGAWSEKDFNDEGKYQEGPTESSGTGKCNEGS